MKLWSSPYKSFHVGFYVHTSMNIIQITVNSYKQITQQNEWESFEFKVLHDASMHLVNILGVAH
jgi:hypothetical protein